MSFCPKPDSVAVSGAAGAFTANPPNTRNESCNVTVTTVTSGGSGTSTTVFIEGPPGPQGLKGDAGTNGNHGLGFQWEGEWMEDVGYFKATEIAHPHASVVSYNGNAFVCIQDHISDQTNTPIAPWETTVGEGGAYWALMTGYDKTLSSLLPEEKSLFDKIADVFDWMKNANLTDWLKIGAYALGLHLAGQKIKDMMAGEPPWTGEPDCTYSGSDGYDGAYVAPGLQEVVSSLCDYGDIQYDASLLSTEPCEFTIGNSSSIRSILEQLSLAYQFDMVNSGGVLKFVPRGWVPTKTILLTDMGFTAGSTPPSPFTSKRFQGIDLPRYVSLTYVAEDVDYNPCSQSAELFTYPNGQVVNLEVPVTLSHVKAKKIVETSLINAHLERMNYRFNTSYKFIDLEPGDIVDSPMGLIRILKINEVDEGVLEFEACDAGGEESVNGSDVTPQLPTPSNNVAPVVGWSQALWIDPPVMNDNDKNVRLMAAVHGYGVAGWPGAAIYVSEDDGQSYEQIGMVSKEATVGIVETITETGAYLTWDDVTEIVVKLKTGTLLSKVELAVLNGANLCQIGQEILAFKNAELIADKTYRLTGLLRGRRGTEWAVDTHGIDELFVLLDDAIVNIQMTDADRNQTKKFKVVTFGSSLEVTGEDEVQVSSSNCRPWAVHNAVAVKINNDFTITWGERVRFNGGLKDYSAPMHDFDYGGFGVAILDGANNDAVKSTRVLQGTSFTYTQAMQVADFGSPQTDIKVSIVPMSTKWGGGYPVVINS